MRFPCQKILLIDDSKRNYACNMPGMVQWPDCLLNVINKLAKDLSFLHADSENSDHTGRMPRLICVFAGRICHFVGFVMRRHMRPSKTQISLGIRPV